MKQRKRPSVNDQLRADIVLLREQVAKLSEQRLRAEMFGYQRGWEDALRALVKSLGGPKEIAF
jgi:hypothetical protein